MSGFSQTEALALIGKTCTSKSLMDGIPPGAQGRIVAAQEIGQGWELKVEWYAFQGRRINPWWIWMGKEQIEKRLEGIAINE